MPKGNKKINKKINSGKGNIMRIFFSALLLVIFINVSSGQSIQDIQKLKNLQKQIEQAAGEKSSPNTATSIKSLNTFDDSLSALPNDQLKTLKIKQMKRLDADQTEKKALTQEEELKNLKPFGYDIFSKAKLDIKPSLFGPVPSDYPLGPGDEVVITLWGEVELRHSLIIDRNGQLMIPDVGLVNIAGFTLDQVKKKLYNILKNYYSGLKQHKITLEVSLGKLRSIRVFVTGEVNQPGVFTVPAYISPFAMMFYAGGVTTSGSLREIVILRDNKQFAKIDFYAFLTGQQLNKTIQLHNRDIIVITPIQNRVFIAGAVGRPAIYEFKQGETLQQLLSFAGNPLPDANLNHIEIVRYISHKKPMYINIDIPELKAKSETTLLSADDHIYVYKIDKKLENFVIIDGPIYGPKRFAYTKKLTIKKLFTRVDSIKSDAYLERAVVIRQQPTGRAESYSINLDCILNGGCRDFLLAPRDSIFFKSGFELFPIDSVSIYGAVNNPGNFLLSKNLSLMDLIYLAGGFAINAKIDSVEISRPHLSIRTGNQITEIIKVPINSDYKLGNNKEAENFQLEPYDNVYVYINSDWQLQRNVTVTGEVYRPGTYSLETKEDKLTDIINRAGGLKPTSFIEGAQFYRAADSAGHIGLNFVRAIEDPNSEENIILEDGDKFFIPQRRYTVKVMGGVNFPSSVLFNENMSIRDYIDAAGGLTELADEDNISIMLANGKRFKERSFLIFFSHLPEDITPGSIIFVPTLNQKNEIDWSGGIRDAAAILASIASVILIINQVNSK